MLGKRLDYQVEENKIHFFYHAQILFNYFFLLIKHIRKYIKNPAHLIFFLNVKKLKCIIVAGCCCRLYKYCTSGCGTIDNISLDPAFKL